MRVFVYRNLHRKCYSVKALEGVFKGRVIAHTDSIVLSNVTFKVSKAGRERVLREKRKNVHAGVVGTIEEDCPSFVATQQVRYNPYLFETFVCRGDAILNAPLARLGTDGISIGYKQEVAS